MILETSQLLSWGGAWDGRRGQRREFHTVQQSPVGSASHKLLCVCVAGEWSCVGWEVYRTDFCWDRVSAILPKPIGF